MKSQRMIFALSTAVLVAGVSGCGKSDQSTGAGFDESAVESTAMPEPISPTAARIGPKSLVVASCNLETVNGQPSEGVAIEVKRQHPVTISGWVVDEKAKKVPGAVRLRIQSGDGRLGWEQPVAKWIDRSDVADRWGRSYLSSGFELTLNLSELPPGRYGFYVAYDTSSGETACGVGRQIVMMD